MLSKPIFTKDYYNGTVVPFFLRPEVPFIAVAFYLVTVVFLAPTPSPASLKKDDEGKTEKKTEREKKPLVLDFLFFFTAAHNIILTVYSGWTFYNTLPIVRNYLVKHNPEGNAVGYFEVACDRDAKLWGSGTGFDDSVGWWITHFYLSKYYEFIDTWIIMAKGKKPELLQTYHHAGVVILMWAFVYTKNTSCGMILTVLNSFIHTIMYCYYFFAVIGYTSPYAKYLTQAQLTQFFTGIALTCYPYIEPTCYKTVGQMYSLYGIHLYTIILIYLFLKFFFKKYSKDKKKDVKKVE